MSRDLDISQYKTEYIITLIEGDTQTHETHAITQLTPIPNVGPPFDDVTTTTITTT